MPVEKKEEDLNRPVSAFLDSLFDTSSDKRQLQYGIAPNELPPRTQDDDANRRANSQTPPMENSLFPVAEAQEKQRCCGY